MEEKLEQLDLLLRNDEVDKEKIQNLMNEILNTQIKGLKIENYIGDYPTFMEPVILGDKVKIGDDVLLGPRIYIGANSEIGDYVEISNSLIFDDVKIGENIMLNNCVVAKGCELNFNNFIAKNCILKGIADSKNELEIIPF